MYTWVQVLALHYGRAEASVTKGISVRRALEMFDSNVLMSPTSMAIVKCKSCGVPQLPAGPKAARGLGGEQTCLVCSASIKTDTLDSVMEGLVQQASMMRISNGSEVGAACQTCASPIIKADPAECNTMRCLECKQYVCYTCGESMGPLVRLARRADVEHGTLATHNHFDQGMFSLRPHCVCLFDWLHAS
jgi:hypothetical protein